MKVSLEDTPLHLERSYFVPDGEYNLLPGVDLAKNVIFTPKQVQAGVRKIAEDVAAHCRDVYGRTGRPVIFVGILDGVRPTLHDLLTHMGDLGDAAPQCQALKVRTRDENNAAMREPIIKEYFNPDIFRDRNVVVVDDMVHDGSTLKLVVNYLEKRHAASVKSAVLIQRYQKDDTDEKDRSIINVPQADWAAFNLSRDYEKHKCSWLIGFGLDTGQMPYSSRRWEGVVHFDEKAWWFPYG